jgi:hypothetical protein
VASALNTYEPRIQAKVDQLLEKISLKREPIDATSWTMYLSFDVMGEVGFSNDFGCTTTGSEHPAIQGIHAHMKVLSILSHVPWMLNLLSCVPGATAGCKLKYLLFQGATACQEVV